jgi:hypothetical protein
MSEVSDIPFGRVLDPMERISETLFGLIMALTFICSLGVATGANINIQTMLIGALGCNLAWGIGRIQPVVATRALSCSKELVE